MIRLYAPKNSGDGQLFPDSALAEMKLKGWTEKPATKPKTKTSEDKK